MNEGSSLESDTSTSLELESSNDEPGEADDVSIYTESLITTAEQSLSSESDSTTLIDISDSAKTQEPAPIYGDFYSLFEEQYSKILQFDSLRSTNSSVIDWNVLLDSKPNTEATATESQAEKEDFSPTLIGLRQFKAFCRNTWEKSKLFESSALLDTLFSEPIKVLDRCESVDVPNTIESLQFTLNILTPECSEESASLTSSSYDCKYLFQSPPILISSEGTETRSSEPDYDESFVTEPCEDAIISPRSSSSSLISFSSSSLKDADEELSSSQISRPESDASLAQFVRRMLTSPNNERQVLVTETEKKSTLKEYHPRMSPVLPTERRKRPSNPLLILMTKCAAQKATIYSGQDAEQRIPELLKAKHKSKRNVKFARETENAGSECLNASVKEARFLYSNKSGSITYTMMIYRHFYCLAGNKTSEEWQTLLASRGNLKFLTRRSPRVILPIEMKNKKYKCGLTLNKRHTKKDNKILVIDLVREVRRWTLEPRYLAEEEITSYRRVVQQFVDGGFFQSTFPVNSKQFSAFASVMKAYLSVSTDFGCLYVR
ncbi:hypothetical protein Ciccas_000769 [Cichlidogyrus casuarinus]|uniref:Uncharacterized protein n=1 Tax=Cichlidogyrus casuarinus TaxID=1844966 RepID=A0ABD2QLZ1_9PLAT